MKQSHTRLNSDTPDKTGKLYCFYKLLIIQLTADFHNRQVSTGLLANKKHVL